MQKVHEQRKKQLVSSFVSLLNQLQLTNTAAVLTEEAQLNRQKNIQEDIKEILNARMVSQGQRKSAIEQYCKYSIQNYLREGKIDQALQIYEVIVPLHCPNKIEEFSFLFAETHQNNHKGISILLESFLERPNILPQTRKSCLCLGNEIWFIHALGGSLLLIDCYSNAVIVFEDEVTHKRELLHNDRVSSVSVGPQCMFVTGSKDKLVKIWDKSIELLHIIDTHHANINSVLFFDSNLIVFDQQLILSVHSLQTNIANSTKIERITAFKTHTNFIDLKYAKSRKKILGVSNKKDVGGHINIVNLQKKRVEKMVSTQQKIYTIQVSFDDKMVFANVSSNEILAFSLGTRHELLFKLSGFMQEKNLMRMSQGGKQGKYLAVTSEEGSVRIYSIKDEDEVVRLIGESKQSINCILWKDNDLYFGCDAGNLEHWVCRAMERQPNQISRAINGKKIGNGSKHLII